MTKQADFSAGAMRRWVTSKLEHKPTSEWAECNLRKCPKCDDTKFHVYFNFQKKVGWCHKNECVFSFLDLMQEFYGPTLTLEGAVIELYEDYSDFEIEQGIGSIDRADILLEAMTLSGTPVGKELKIEPDGYTPLTVDCVHPVMLYAITRRIPPEELYGGDFGYTDVEGPDKNRLITIIRDSGGDAVGWQARAIMGQNPKYLYPPSSVTGSKVSDLVGRIHRCPDAGGKLVVNEGLFSAIASDLPGKDAYGVCMFGGHMSEAQKSIILSVHPLEVILVQEPGVSDARAMHRMMELCKAGVPVSAIKMPIGDPESHPELYREMFNKRSLL